MLEESEKRMDQLLDFVIKIEQNTIRHAEITLHAEDVVAAQAQADKLIIDLNNPNSDAMEPDWDLWSDEITLEEGP